MTRGDAGSLCRLIGGDHTDHDLGAFHRGGRAVTGGHAGILDPAAHLGFGGGIRQLDIKGAHALAAKAGGDGQSSFAEPDE